MSVGVCPSEGVGLSGGSDGGSGVGIGDGGSDGPGNVDREGFVGERGGDGGVD